MTVSITSCPQCNTLLLAETAQCPQCHHVLDPERATKAASRPSQAPPVASATGRVEDASGYEEPCPKCGEMVRIGLVRCWHCGTFMRSEIAAMYQKLKESDVGVTPGQFPDLPDVTESEVPASDAGSADALDDDEGDTYALRAEDDDFELSLKALDSAGSMPSAEVIHVNRPAPPESATPTSQAPTSPAPAPAPSAETPANPEPAAGAPPAAESAPAADADAGSDTQPERSDQTATEASTAEGEESSLPHSEATGGDVLLQIALEEQKESGGPPSGQFIVFCPNGHRIAVQERHRGKMGRCRRCRALFIVPEAEAPPADEAQAETPEAAQTSDAAEPAASTQTTSGRIARWLDDIHLHVLDLEKLKLKADSLKNDFRPVDVGLAGDGMLLVTLAKPGLFGTPEKKRAEVREKVRAHMAEDKPIEELPAAEHIWLEAEKLAGLRVVQPAAVPHESMFQGIPVFGKGRIAVMLPQEESADVQQPRFLSFTLSEFRTLHRALDELFDMRDFGSDSGIPLTERYTEATCHYTDQPLKILEDVEFYQADSTFTLKTIGYRCGGCGLVISEDGRKKEQIGGKSGRGIAKAKCPKCGSKFGDNPLWGLEEATPQSDASSEDAPSSQEDSTSEDAPQSEAAEQTQPEA